MGTEERVQGSVYMQWLRSRHQNNADKIQQAVERAAEGGVLPSQGALAMEKERERERLERARLRNTRRPEEIQRLQTYATDHSTPAPRAPVDPKAYLYD